MKQFLLFLILATLFASCNNTQATKKTTSLIEETDQFQIEAFQNILDSSGLKGSILIFDGMRYHSNDFDWAQQGHLPASTFKIPNSIIAFELGIMKNDSTVSKWDGEPRFMKRWEQDLYFRDAFHLSCVPCYQEVARKVGVSLMKDFVGKLNYGEMVVDSSNIDFFWLEGKSRINQFQQIAFLQAFNEKKLPISERTHSLMRRMMIIEENENFVLRGKTGWSVTNGEDNCWFVGWVETSNGAYYFATNVEPGEGTNSDDLFTLRKDVTYKALEMVAL